MKDYIGVDIKKDSDGILQDVHWSAGLIGYFPTYSFGNLYAAQFYATLLKKVPKTPKLISKGNFKPVLEWLRENIHMHGKKYTAGRLVQKVTGEPLNAVYFQKYLEHKYRHNN